MLVFSAENRDLSNDQQSRAEAALEAAFARDVAQALLVFYRLPLSLDFSNQEGNSADEIAEWLLGIYNSQGEMRSAFSDLLNLWSVSAANLGGQMALNHLGVLASFELTNSTELATIRERADELASVDGERSLLRTTANDVARAVVREQSSGASATVAALGALATDRAAVRALLIAETESVLSSRAMVIATCVRNGARTFKYICEPDVEERCSTGVCIPYCGLRFQATITGAIPRWARLPKHPRCRCKHRPIKSGWQAPEVVWTGGD